MNQRSLQNLRPRAKGHSGNPGGRPSGRSVLAKINAELAKPTTIVEDRRRRTRADRIAERLASLAEEAQRHTVARRAREQAVAAWRQRAAVLAEQIERAEQELGTVGRAGLPGT